jgi:hypothetical protein
MPFAEHQLAHIEAAMADFLLRRRPLKHMRNRVDLAYRIEEHCVVIYEVRSWWRDARRKIEGPVAKATSVKEHNRWRICWHRGDLRWHRYVPHPEAVVFDEFLAVVYEDADGCFGG